MKAIKGYEERVKEIYKDHLRELQNDQMERLTLEELLEEIDRLCPDELKHDKYIRDTVMKTIKLIRKLD